MVSSTVAVSESEYFALAESESPIPTNEFSNLKKNTIGVILSSIVAESSINYNDLAASASSTVIVSSME